MIVMKHQMVSSEFSARNAGTATPSGRRGERSTDEQLEQVKRTALLQQKITALESDVTTLRNERERVLSRDTLALHRQDDTGLPGQLSEADMQDQRKQEEERIFLQIGHSFSAQPIDQDWSVSMTDRINEHIRTQQLKNSSVEKIECRSSVCKIEIDIHDSANLAEIRDNFRFRMADVMTSGASKKDETGRFIIYLAKDPQALGMTAQP
jgi:hypothetical protein